MAFREQAVEDGYFDTIGKIINFEGTQCVAVNGEKYEWYQDGNYALTFKMIGSAMSFKVTCEDLPFENYHNN